jgi:excisionase family DNA binding protein
VLFLAPKDAARILGLSTSRIIQLDREGRLRALRDSAGRRLYRRRDVEAFAARRRGTNANSAGTR